MLLTLKDSVPVDLQMSGLRCDFGMESVNFLPDLGHNITCYVTPRNMS